MIEVTFHSSPERTRKQFPAVQSGGNHEVNVEMSKSFEYFYDFVSPYSYLAQSQLPALVGRTGAEIVYRPFFLGGVMQSSGNSPPATVPAKAKYMPVDIAPVALDDGCHEAYNTALFEAMWLHEKNVAELDVLAEVISGAGLDVDSILKRIANEVVKERLKANTAEAVERGAFGSPTFFIDDEMFFGNDRLEGIGNTSYGISRSGNASFIAASALSPMPSSRAEPQRPRSEQSVHRPRKGLSYLPRSLLNGMLSIGGAENGA